MSASLPTLTVPPNPPSPCRGQRKASIAGANPASPNPIAMRTPRFRTWRRLTPISSSSTGSYSTTSPPRRRASIPPNDEARVSSERSRPVASSSVDVDAGASVDVDAVASSLRLRVSRDNDPVDAARARPASITTETAATNKMTMMTNGTSTDELLQLEEDALVPGEDEVEAFAPEERTDDHEHGPHHQEHGQHDDRELAIGGFVRRVLVDVRRDREHTEGNAGNGHTRNHGVEHLE